MLIAQNWPPLATAVWGQYTRPMRKYLDIPLTLIVLFTLTVAMLWPLDQPPPAPAGSDKIVHFIAFAALACPHGPLWPDAGLHWRERLRRCH